MPRKRNKMRPARGKRQTKLWIARKRAVGRAPAYLKTVMIGKPAYRRTPGTFGAASEVVSIDPETGLPRDHDDGRGAAA